MKASLRVILIGLFLAPAAAAASCGGGNTGAGGSGGGGGIAGGLPSASSSTGGIGGFGSTGGGTSEGGTPMATGGSGQGGNAQGGSGGGTGGAPNDCQDNTKDDNETDVDCGGGACPTCDLGKTCIIDADCTSTHCLGGVCSAGPTCTDMVKDGMETDVDCGGSACPKCADTKSCNLGSDCTSGVCASGSCAAPNCNDGVKNEDETDIDCGGATCPACAVGSVCTMDSDCSSTHCVGNVCVECIDNTECTGTTDDCQHPACTNNACGPVFTMTGTPVTTQVPGDCHTVECDGMGGTTNTVDDNDVPVDGNSCTTDTCDNGTPSNPGTAVGTACSQTGGSICNGTGSCVALNVMVVRVGDGATTLSSTAAPVFIEEWPFSGAETRTIPLPVAASGTNQAFSLAGTGTSEGELSRSVDGHYVVLGGYAAVPTTSAVAGTMATTVNRVVARVDAMGNVDTSTTLGTTAFSSNPIRGAATIDGTSFWATGNGSSSGGGAWYAPLGMPASALQIDNAPANMRWAGIFGGQLYGTSGSGTFVNVFTIGTGEPTTTGQTSTSLPGMLTSMSSPYGFALLDRNPAVTGLDTLYVSDDNSIGNATSPGGVHRWTFNGTVWAQTALFNGGLASGVRGVTATVVGSSVVIIATTAENPSRLVAFVDDGVVTTGTAIVIATSPANEFYRGVAVSPN
jgi:hypothetical protein